MKLARMTAATIIATTAIALNADPAEASPAECAITFQPYIGQYNADLVHADGSVEHVLTGRQHHDYEVPPVTFTRPAGQIATVLWARMPDGSGWGDTLHVTDDCRFVEEYKSEPGRRDSVVIAAVEAPVTTLPPTTTSTAPPAPPVTELRTTPTPTTEAPPATTIPVPPPVDVPLVETPTTTEPVQPPPTAPVPSTPDTVELLTATPPVYGDAGNPGPTLPETGGNALGLLWAGGATAAMGVLLIGLDACRRRLATLRTKGNQ